MNDIENFPNEFTKSISLFLYLLKSCNIDLYDERDSFIRKHWRFLVLLLFFVIHYVTMTFFMYRIDSDITVIEIAFMFSMYVLFTQNFIKGGLILQKKTEIRNLISLLGNSWRTDNLSDLQIAKKLKFLKTLNCSGAVYFRCGQLAAIQNLLAPLFITIIRKFILNQETELLLPIGCVYPFDPVKDWFRYILVLVFQSYIMLHMTYHYIGADMMIITLCALLTIEFALLRDDLKQVTLTSISSEPKEYSSVNKAVQSKSIRDFVKRHQYLLGLTDLLNGICGKMVFVNMLMITVVLCFFAFGASVANSPLELVNNFIPIFAGLFQVFVLCYFAELLNAESSGLADSTYETLWYKSDKRHKQIIRFIIARSQRACCLKSLNYSPITLNTFTKVVSTTWSYLSLARSMLNEN